MAQVADLVDNLFRTITKEDGSEYSYQEVADEIRKFGGDIDPTSIWKLRKGRSENPSRKTVLYLCAFFKVPPSYFFPELDKEQHSEEVSIRIALKSSSLPEDVQHHIEGIINAFREKQRREL